MKMHLLFIMVVLLHMACSSGNKQVVAPETAATTVPTFMVDSAYAYVAAQCAFGPRILGSVAHRVCADYLTEQLRRWGATIYEQPFNAILYDGTIHPARNIIAVFAPEQKKRLLLCAHWDSRAWADNDPDPTKHHTPVMGANDGASGVGVLLEIARNIAQEPPTLGVDIVFFDAEDYGTPQFYMGKHDADSWCLGSQYWSANPHVEPYNARFGILLDMVGGRGATFYYEGYSRSYAPSVTSRVWETAKSLGFGNTFLPYLSGYVTDDHVAVNEIAKIPCIDIIPYDEHCEASGFGQTWHTTYDTMENIDKQTLHIVGQTVMTVIYNEK